MPYVNYNKVTDWTKEKILFQLQTDDEWVERALVVIFERQTAMERDPRIDSTLYKNEVGFQVADAKWFSKFARKIIGGERLSPAQLRYARRPWRRGKTPIPTIAKYRGQLLEIIEAKAKAKLAAL